MTKGTKKRQTVYTTCPARDEQHMIACDLTSDVMSLRKRLDATERARDEARVAIKQALAALQDRSPGVTWHDLVNGTIPILAAANVGLQPGAVK